LATQQQNNPQEIARTLYEKGYAIIEPFITYELGNSLLNEFQNTPLDKFKKAGIGRHKDFNVNSNIRTDQIYWLENNNLAIREYFNLLEKVRLAVNETLFLGLFDFECHFAYYPIDSFYQKHIDAFQGSSVRVLSSILYLNPDWQNGDGGELKLYAPKDSAVLETTAPTFCKQIFFLSQEFPHEVLITKKPRYSITGWFRINDFTNPQNQLR